MIDFKKIALIGAAGLGLLLLTRRRANAHGIIVQAGKSYRADVGQKLHYPSDPYYVFALTGSNANFFVHSLVTAVIGGGSKEMAVVTYVQDSGTVIDEWTFLISPDAFTQKLTY